MNHVRKAMWPTAIVAGLLLFFGALGVNTPQVAFADDEDICAIDGPDFIAEGLHAYWVTLDDGDEDAETWTATVDDGTGSGNIVFSLDGTNTSDLNEVGPTQIVQDLEGEDEDDFTTGLNNLLASYGFTEGDDCGDTDDDAVDTDDEDDATIVLIVVECDEIGTFTVSFSDDFEDDDSLSIAVECRGDVDDGTITARPSTVEIIPSFANVAHSLIVVTLVDDNGDPAFPGNQVLFQTNKCSIEESAVDTEEEYLEAAGIFGALNPLVPVSAFNVENSAAATTGPDGGSPQLDESASFTVNTPSERTIAAAVLHCDPVHAVGVTPGPAVVTAIIDRAGDDLVLTTTVTVVGPPAASGITVTAAPASLICGEKATITVTVKDSIGQPVSDHTIVEAVTNFGGVLGGTGAVAGFAGPVVPISSTVAETFGGVATFYLLTSDAHTGKYEVVVTTGGGGGVASFFNPFGSFDEFKAFFLANHLGGLFTSAPISVQVTVECSQPAAAPAASAPATGQGSVKPPSTGDAGLASSDSSSWVLVAGLAVVASLVAAGFVTKLVRDED